MLGPLPRSTAARLRLALVACIGVGAWLAFTLPDPARSPRAGAAIGAAPAPVVFLLLHDGDARTRRASAAPLIPPIVGR